MRILLLLIISISLTTILTAQKKWNVGITTGIGYSGWITKKDNGWLQTGEKIGERLAPAYNGGILLSTPLSDRLAFQTGISYQNSASRSVHKVKINNTRGIDEKFRNISKHTYRLHQLQIPILLQTKFKKHTKGFFMNIGIVPNYILGGKWKDYNYNSRRDTKVRRSDALDFSIDANQSLRFFIQPIVGIGYTLSERWTIATNLTWDKIINYKFYEDDVDCFDSFCTLGTNLYNRRSFSKQEHAFC